CAKSQAAGKNTPRCKLLMFFPPYPTRPGRTSRLLSCPGPVGGPRLALPPRSLAKLRPNRSSDLVSPWQVSRRFAAVDMPNLWRPHVRDVSPNRAIQTQELRAAVPIVCRTDAVNGQPLGRGNVRCCG